MNHWHKKKYIKGNFWFYEQYILMKAQLSIISAPPPWFYCIIFLIRVPKVRLGYNSSDQQGVSGQSAWLTQSDLGRRALKVNLAHRRAFEDQPQLLHAALNQVKNTPQAGGISIIYPGFWALKTNTASSKHKHSSTRVQRSGFESERVKEKN